MRGRHNLGEWHADRDSNPGEYPGLVGRYLIKVNEIFRDPELFQLLREKVLPELIALDPWGYPIVAPGPVPGPLLPHARRAAAACPTLALLLRQDGPVPPVGPA